MDALRLSNRLAANSRPLQSCIPCRGPLTPVTTSVAPRHCATAAGRRDGPSRTLDPAPDASKRSDRDRAPPPKRQSNLSDRRRSRDDIDDDGPDYRKDRSNSRDRSRSSSRSNGSSYSSSRRDGDRAPAGEGDRRRAPASRNVDDGNSGRSRSEPAGRPQQQRHSRRGDNPEDRSNTSSSNTIRSSSRRDGDSTSRPRVGRREEKPAVDGSNSNRTRLRSPSSTQSIEAPSTAPPPPPPAPPAPRPPGSSTGNRPLPYDLPLVRPGEGDKGTFFSGRGWRQVGASEEVVAALRELGIKRPSHIQAEAMSRLLPQPGKAGGGPGPSAGSGGAVVLADQAGSGKTLAYLLPLMQILRAEEAEAGGRVTRPNCPRGIVVAPTVELVQQVLRVVRALSGAGLRCRSAAATGGQVEQRARAASIRTQRELLSEGVDLLVCTPGRLQQLVASGAVRLEGCRALVMDEVDVLMGDHADFLGQVSPLLSAAPPSMRLVLVTATLPQHVWGQLREAWGQLRAVQQQGQGGQQEGGEGAGAAAGAGAAGAAAAGELQAIFGPGLHRTAAGLVEELVDCSGGDEVSEESGRKRKLEALQALLSRHAAPRTLVFCNKIPTCREVENFLARADPKQRKYRILPYHEAIREDLRSQHMTQFLQPVSEAGRRAQRARQQQFLLAKQQQQQKEEEEGEGQKEEGDDVWGGGVQREEEEEELDEELEQQLRRRQRQEKREKLASRSSNSSGKEGHFVAAPDVEEASTAGTAGEEKEGEHVAEEDVPLVMVATDRTSRGIDAPYCEHVVLFDFPRDPSEYVRRVGRTARGAGGRGVVSSLVLGRQVPLAREIIERNQKGMPVHSVPA
ncbi:hypothetical protein Agub_g3439 [Astrephomene gubernaculifera]|uniref:RNA helicase n=1 Tax=Astrephomene gubernaculifera TaxID=47775 RepID=A0AAD3DJW4_9CHLO|nr:hypothetical protein Agub_g3439 [Astrephomene gubernaculifera]